MRIGFDAKRANANNTGLGNYSRFVIGALAEHAPTNEYLMYVPKSKEQSEYKDMRRRFSTLDERSPKNSVFGSLWRSYFIGKDLQKDKIDIYHGLSNEIPFGIKRRGLKSVVTIHDLIFLRYPKLYRPLDRWIYKQKFSYACRHSDHIIAVSEQTKQDIINFFGIDEEKISVIYQGCAAHFAQKQSEEKKAELRAKYFLPQKFLLNVGTLEERKNLGLIIEALVDLPEELHLVACGRATAYSKKIMERAQTLGLGKRIHLIHNAKYMDLAILNQMAEVVLYPSRFEGFGIPIIEALSGGAALVAATGSCLEEAGGEGALYVSPDDSKSLAEAITRLREDSHLRETCRKKGLEHIKRFSKESIAGQITRLYERLIAE